MWCEVWWCDVRGECGEGCWGCDVRGGDVI